MRASWILAALLTLTSCVTPGPSVEHRAVLATVERFFAFIETRDPELGTRTLLPDGVFVTVSTADGKRVVRSFRNEESIERMRNATQPMREAFLGEPMVLVDGDVAVVWARYLFEVDGRRSHTGVDAFNLVRTSEGWRICGGAYSIVR